MKQTGWTNSSSYITGIAMADNMILFGTASDESEHFRKTALKKIWQDISVHEIPELLKNYVIIRPISIVLQILMIYQTNSSSLIEILIISYTHLILDHLRN